MNPFADQQQGFDRAGKRKATPSSLQIRTQRNVGGFGDQVIQGPPDDLEGHSCDRAAEKGPEEQHEEPDDLGQGGRRELVQEMLRNGPAVLASVEGDGATVLPGVKGGGVARLPGVGVESIPLDDHLTAGRHPGDGTELRF
ncbi:hypothetical protein PG990_003318 [Apiospora arundinis]